MISNVFEENKQDELYAKKTTSCDFNTISRNMRELLARKNQNMLWGNGFTFQSDNPKIVETFRKIDKQNNLLNLFAFCERELSKLGRCIVTINKRKNGEIAIGMGIPNWFNGVGRTFIQEELAVVYQRFKLDQTNFVMKSTYDRKKCINEFYGEDGTMLVLDKQMEIANELRIEREWKHNLGFVPVRELINLPLFFYDYRNTDYTELSDWFPARQFENVMYEIYVNMIKEINICHSRIAIEGSNQKVVQDLQKQMANSSEFISVGDIVIETEIQGKVTFVPGNADFQKYTSTMNDTMDFYFKFANSSRFSDGGGAQKTSAEANSTKDTTIENIMSKIKHREQQYSQLINLLLSAYGVADADTNEYDFVFKINGNVEHNESALVDNVIKQIQIGTMSIVEGIEKIRIVNKEQAERIFDDIKKFNEENDIATSNDASQQEQEIQKGANDGGAPTKEGSNK